MADDELAELRSILDVTYTPEGVDIWLDTPKPIWGGRTAFDMIAVGRIAEVIERARRIER
jgi:hypothetical protein